MSVNELNALLVVEDAIAIYRLADGSPVSSCVILPDTNTIDITIDGVVYTLSLSPKFPVSDINPYSFFTTVPNN